MAATGRCAICEFLSGLTFGPKLEGKFGRYYSDPITTNSHTELEAKLKISDRHADPHHAKWEFVPGPKGIADFDGYKFRLDENRAPSWWTEDIEADTIAYAKSVLARVVLFEGELEELREPVYALAGTVRVKSLYTQVCTMWGSSQVGSMRGSSQVGTMRGSSHVGSMWDSSQVGTMRGSSHVGTMRGSSHVGTMRGSSQVGTMWGSSQVGTMWDSSQVGTMRGSSQVVAWSEEVAKKATLADFALIIERSPGALPIIYSAKGTYGQPKTKAKAGAL